MMTRTTVCVCFALLAASARAEIPVKDGEKIAFLGDSITQGGMGPMGYVSLVIHGLNTAGVTATAIGAGISGHKSNQMLERVDRDVIAKKPDWMTLSCGVNDVWHGAAGVPLDKYKTNITAIVDKAQAAGIKVVILTATMITEDAGSPNNRKLAEYNDFLRELAKEKKCLLADLNVDMQAAVVAGSKEKRGNILTTDGVHMNAAGNQMMAAGILRTLGLSDEQLAKAKDAWNDIPGGAAVSVRAALTQRQFKSLEAIAKKQNKTVDALLQGLVDGRLAELLKSADAK